MSYWLMKNEPDSYGIDDLARDVENMWEGCRNYQVRNYLRDSMNVGDLAFFYHSNADPAGVAGIMEIVSEAYPDTTQFDPSSEYYDPKSSTDAPRWVTRTVRFVRKLDPFVPLTLLKQTPGLRDLMGIRKGNRLSITPVADSEWHLILELELALRAFKNSE